MDPIQLSIFQVSKNSAPSRQSIPKMAPSSIRKALGAVKDQTSISLAKVSNSTSLSDLEVAIVKATRHEEYPPDERYTREILSLTSYSRTFVNVCVGLISRRLNKTRNWTVALKTLMLIHKLLLEGDGAYEQEFFFATRRGTRLLNLSDFRDTSRSGCWEYSAFVRSYALYLDERLEYRMHSKREARRSGHSGDEEEEEGKTALTVKSIPVWKLKTERIFQRAQHLQNLLDRLLTCRPSGDARNNRVVLVALYPVLKESFQLYYNIAEILGILVDRFMELEVSDCIKIQEIFARISKQLEELDQFYCWSKAVGIARSSDYPEVEKITQKKLEIMDEFIRDKAILAKSKQYSYKEATVQITETTNEEEKQEGEDMNEMKALPPPEVSVEEEQKEEMEQETSGEDTTSTGQNTKQEPDLLDLRDDSAISQYEGDNLALALFDGAAESKPAWEAFKPEETSDWEAALVESATSLAHRKPNLGGGLDNLTLDGMYQQSAMSVAMASTIGTGSASSVAAGAGGKPPMLALPAPSSSSSDSRTQLVSADPFAASLGVAPPPYVQISDMEKKQQLLVEEQLMWQQYAKNGMQARVGMPHYQQNTYTTGGLR